MACKCIPGNAFQVTNVELAANVPIQSHIYPQLKAIHRELCVWAKPTKSAASEPWTKAIWQAALIAVAVINTAAQISITKKRYQIAKDYANLAKDRWTRFRDNYAPLERAMLNEVANAPIYEPDYPGARRRAQEHSSSAFFWANDQMADLATKYGLCLDPSFSNDMDLAEALSRDDGTNFNYRDEEFFALYKQDQRWNRRSTLLDLGRDLHAQSASYATAANDALKTVGGLLDAGAAGATKLLGYLSTVGETQYPATFSAATPLTGQSSAWGSMLAMGPTAL